MNQQPPWPYGGQPSEGPPPGGYYPYPPPPGPVPGGYRRTNVFAILALIFAFLFWPLGIVFGHIARSQIRRSGEGGAGLALAGLIISYIFLGLLVIVIVLGVSISAHGASTSHVTRIIGPS